MTDIMQQECRSLLQKLKVQQRNLNHYLPSDKSDSTVSDNISNYSDSWASSPGQSASYARSCLKKFITSPPTETDSFKSSFNDSTDSSTKNSYKPKIYLHDTGNSKPRQYRRSVENSPRNNYHKEVSFDSTTESDTTPKQVDTKTVMSPPTPVNVTGNFLRDMNNYLDESKGTLASLYSEYDSMSQKSTPQSKQSDEFSSLSSTPNTAQKRHLIDRNIPVPSLLEDFQYDTNQSKLNFSYSTVDDDEEESFLKSGLNATPEDIFLKMDKEEKFERRWKERQENERNARMNKKDDEFYKKQLKDSGNDRTFVSIVKDSVKPRSILASPNSRSYNSKNKSSSRVSFKSMNSFDDRTQQEDIPTTSKLMGYDWIAALLDNETGAVDESESYFQELKDFRRANRDECSNNFYMNNTLSYAQPKEESAVAKALIEPKVKPYIVNDRLFTEPLKKKLDGDNSDNEESEPTTHSPRYVRVSIPRSTLEKSYKVKPHRRNSFDPTDSCSLREHCLMGWENSRVSVLPTASSVDINDATRGMKPKMTTTLAEAELVARTGTTQLWPFLPPPKRVDLLPTWRKNYESSVMNLSHPSSLTNSVIPGNSDSLRNSTNSLLNSTYSMMYEMERLKKERESTKA